MTILAIILSVLLLLSLIAFVYYCMKGGNMIIGLVITALCWFLFGTIYSVTAMCIDKSYAGYIANPTFIDGWNMVIGNLNIVFSDGPIGYGTTTAIIIFASWFGRVVVDTGIAKALIRKVVELSGNQQLVTIIVVSIVSALIFTSIFGPGSVMAIGAIILPILLSIGVDKKLAVGSFLFSVAAGMYVNGGYISQFSGNNIFKPIWQLEGFNNSFTTWTWVAFAIHVVIMLGFILFNYYMARNKAKSWAMSADDASSDYDIDDQGNSEQEKPVSNWSFIVPFIPIIISLVVSIVNFIPGHKTLTAFAPIVGFLIGIFFGLLLTGNLKTYKKAVETTQKTLFNGFSDVSLLIGMLLILNCFSTAANKLGAPVFQAALGESLHAITNTPWIIFVIFIIIAPAALFRGPMMVWGSGIAVASVLSVINNIYTTPLLLLLFYVQPCAIVADVCPTQSWSMWALSYTKLEPNVYIKTNIAWGWICCALIMTVGWFFLM